MKSFASGIAVAAALISGPAIGADMAVKAPLAAPPVVFSWTGIYIGGNLGDAWSRDHYLSNHVSGTGTCLTSGFVVPCDPVGHKASSIIGGGQIGARWQTGPWALGVEAMYDATHLEQTTPGFNTPATLNYTSNIRSIFTATAQAGYAWDRMLWYVKGGYAGASVHFNSVTLPPPSAIGPVSSWVNGWTIGTGLEYALWNSVSVGAEYDYARLTGSAQTCTSGVASVFSCPVPPGLPLKYANYTADVHQVLVRLNYRFGR